MSDSNHNVVVHDHTKDQYLNNTLKTPRFLSDVFVAFKYENHVNYDKLNTYYKT